MESDYQASNSAPRVIHAGGRLHDYSHYGKFIKNRSNFHSTYIHHSTTTPHADVISLLREPLIDPITRNSEKLAGMRSAAGLDGTLMGSMGVIFVIINTTILIT